MKKTLFTLAAMLLCLAAEAKIIKIVLYDGTVKVYTSSQLSSIDFNDDGTINVTAYDGTVIMESLDVLDVLTIDDVETVYEQKCDTLVLDMDVDGIPLKLNGTRPIQRINYFYPSLDPSGNPISLSGTIIVPDEIMRGESNCEGIILFNHYTIFNRTEAPTEGFSTLESMFLANPLNPNYIMVESDFYGFGATVRFPQAFLQGTNNARASLDGLLAARRIMEGMGLNYGSLCFNVGYSSGGFDAIATQKLRDMEYSDCISFDKTFAGGGPYDISECYRQYVILDETAYNAVPLLLMASTKDTQKMDITYEDVFQPELACRIDELVNSKNYSSWPVCDSVGREKKVHEILMPEFCDLNSKRVQEIISLFDKLSIATGWTPDPTQNLYIYHSRGDDYVPVQSARGIIPFLKGYGFTPSLIPGKTNLQTNFVVRSMGHLTGTIVYLLQTIPAIAAWPQMYTEGQLNPVYAALISMEPNIVATMRQLDELGFNCSAFIQAAMSRVDQLNGGSGEVPQLDAQTLMLITADVCQKMGLTYEEVYEMFYDSGIDYSAFVAELVEYLYQENNASSQNKAAARLEQLWSDPVTPADEYRQTLRKWFGK